MKTTDVLPEAFAASISRFSRSEIDAMPNSSRSVISILDPVHRLFHLDGQPLLLFYIPSSFIRSDTSIKAALESMQLFQRASAGRPRLLQEIRCPTHRLGSTGHQRPHSGATPQVPSALDVAVGIPCMGNTDTKINKVYLNVITTLAACCGEPLAQAQPGPALRWISAAKRRQWVRLLRRTPPRPAGPRRTKCFPGAADDLELSDIPVA
jgi:hypothetical protein